MSDPQGNHYCKHAKDYDEIGGSVECKIIGERTGCQGVWEECVLTTRDEVNMAYNKGYKKGFQEGYDKAVRQYAVREQRNR